MLSQMKLKISLALGFVILLILLAYAYSMIRNFENPSVRLGLNGAVYYEAWEGVGETYRDVSVLTLRHIIIDDLGHETHKAVMAGFLTDDEAGFSFSKVQQYNALHGQLLITAELLKNADTKQESSKDFRVFFNFEDKTVGLTHSDHTMPLDEEAAYLVMLSENNKKAELKMVRSTEELTDAHPKLLADLTQMFEDYAALQAKLQGGE